MDPGMDHQGALERVGEKRARALIGTSEINNNEVELRLLTTPLLGTPACHSRSEKTTNDER
jgi:hypothetical protein